MLQRTIKAAVRAGEQSGYAILARFGFTVHSS
jgi:hypothetical protein